MTIMKTAAALILLSTIANAQPAPKENPTWFIPSGPKPAGQDDQSFCTAELELSTEQYQTRTSEIILPEELEPAVLEPSMIVSWLAREEGRDLEEDLNEEEKKYMISKASTLR